MPSEPPPGWPSVLDVLEGRLRAHAAVLEGADSAPPFEVPDGLGPLPAPLAARAAHIAGRQADLERQVRARMDIVRVLLSRTTAPRRESIFLDTRA